MRKKIIVGLILSLVLTSQIVAAPPWQNTILERIREKKQISVEEFKKKREEFKNLILQKQIELRNKIKEKREKIKSKIEDFKQQLRERMRERISQIKQKIVERIYERVNALNERMTNHYLNVLDRLELILERIESRTAKAKLHGKDVSQVELAINEARLAIDKAREAVEKQAEKVYEPPQITTEENLRTDVGKLRKALHDDLKTVEKLVKEARDLVYKAAVALAQIPRVNEYEVPTTTEQTTTATQQAIPTQTTE